MSKLLSALMTKQDARGKLIRAMAWVMVPAATISTVAPGLVAFGFIRSPAMSAQVQE